MSEADLATVARGIIEANRYMVLGTSDGDGRPWVSPVFYAANGYSEFYWASSPEVTHSRNLAVRPQVSIVIFDSTAAIGAGGESAVYMSGTAEQLADDEIERSLEVYPGPPDRGVRRMTPDELRTSGPLRLYQAAITEHWMLCPMASRPCASHGLEVDHRTAVVL